MHRIVLIGFMASGKTTLAKEVAETLSIPFFDTDKIIEQRYGLSVNEIFALKGEAAFREMEKMVVEELFDVPEFVVAVGGGLPAIPGLMGRLNTLGTTIFLNVPIENILDRLLKDRSERPLLKDKDEDELSHFVLQIYERRMVYYNQAKFVVEKENILCSDLIQILGINHKN